MSDTGELKAIAEYLAGCGNLKDAAFIRSIAIRIKELEGNLDQIKSCAQKVITETHEARKVYGGTLSFAVVCELDKLAKMVKATEVGE